jgi:hypothetical protein
MSDENEPRELKIGRHLARFEPPDLFVVKLVGDFHGSEMLAFADLYKSAKGRFYLLVDTSHMGSFTSEAKKGIKELPIASGVALIGTDPKMQLILSIISKVYIMVSLGKTKIKFVSNEAEGRAWVAELRK